MAVNISTVEQYNNWNPSTEGNANLTNNLVFTSVPSTKIIPAGVTFNGQGNIITFTNVTDLKNLFQMNGGTIMNFTLDLNNDSHSDDTDNAILLTNTIASSGNVQSIKIINTDTSTSGVILKGTFISDNLTFSNIQVGTPSNPLKVPTDVTTLCNQIYADSTVTFSKMVVYWQFVGDNMSGGGPWVYASQNEAASSGTSTVTTFSECISYYIASGSEQYFNQPSLFFVSGKAILNNCYAYSTNNSLEFLMVKEFIVEDVNWSSYVVNSCFMTTGGAFFNTVQPRSGVTTSNKITLNKCAVGTGTWVNQAPYTYVTVSSSNNNSSYNFSTNPTTTKPFNNYSAFFWVDYNSGSVIGAPYLSNMTSSPWTTGIYTSYTAQPLLDLPECLLEGTLIAVDKNLNEVIYKPVQELREGDHVITGNDYLKVRIKSIYSSESHTIPVCVPKGSLGENCPFEDTFVSPRPSCL